MIQKNSYSILFILVLTLSSCVSSPPEKPDNICEIFQEKRSWYKAAIRSEKKWKLPPYVLMAFIHQESSFQESSFDGLARPGADKEAKTLAFIELSAPCQPPCQPPRADMADNCGFFDSRAFQGLTSPLVSPKNQTEGSPGQPASISEPPAGS